MNGVNTTDLLTTAEAAALLGISVPTLHRWADAGKLPTGHKLPGRTGARLFRRSDVDALLTPEASEVASC